MNVLSIEILTLIFTYLHYQEKLKCKLVCRKWADVLGSGLDLETMTISSTWRTEPHSSTRVNCFIKRVEDNPNEGKRCKRIVLGNYYDYVTFARLFPNLDFLGFLPDVSDAKKKYSKIKSYTSLEMKQFQQWHKNLHTFMDFQSDFSSHAFLDTGVFRRLTKIVLLPNWDVVGPRFDILSDKLKNAPNLRIIHLKAVHMTIDDLERLHMNLPFLHSLILKTCIIETIWESPRNMITANEMKRFEMFSCPMSYEFTMPLSKYLVWKYPNLEIFSFSMGLYDFEELNDVDGQHESALAHLVRGVGDTLTSFKTRISTKTPLFYTVLNEEDICLKTLDVNIFYRKRLLKQIVKMDVSSHLVSLSLTQVPPLNFNILKKLLNLKSLHLRFKDKRINKFVVELDRISKDLPTKLEELGLSCVDLCLSSDDKWQFHTSPPEIKHLKIKHSNIKSNLSTYLALRLPKLNSLIINRCHTDFNIELPKQHFSFVYISLHTDGIWVKNKQNTGITKLNRVEKFLKVTVENKTRRYKAPTGVAYRLDSCSRVSLFGKHDHPMYTICKPSPPSLLDDKDPHFHFICASVQTLVFENYLVLLE